MRIASKLLAVGSLGLSMLTGCYSQFPGEGVTHEYHDFIPMSAYSVGTGTGTVSYIAARDGTAYLIDWNRSDEIANKGQYAPHVIGNYMLKQGQGINLDGSAQTVTVGGYGSTTPTVYKNPHLSSENSYEIRFIDASAMLTY